MSHQITRKESHQRTHMAAQKLAFGAMFLLSACGGGGGGGAGSQSTSLTAPTTTTVVDYYSVQNNVLPNFSTYYSSFSGYGGGLYFANTVTTNIDSKPSIIFFIHKTQTTTAPLVNTPVDNAEIIVQRQADGTFTDVTNRLLGAAPFKLNGQAGGATAVTTIIGNSANPTILIAGNAEDGRAINTPGSTDVVVSQAQVPQSDGSYRTLNLGKPIFGGKGSMNSSGGNFYVGDFKRVEANWRATVTNGTGVGTYYQPYYQYDASSSSFIEAGIAPTHAYGYQFINQELMVTSATYFSSAGSGPYGYAFTLANRTGAIWNLAAYTVPFDSINLSYVDTSGKTVNVRDLGLYGAQIDGYYVYNILSSVQGQADLNKDGIPEVVTGLNASFVKNLRSDGKAYEIDFLPYLKLQFWNVIDGKIVPAKITLKDENVAVNQANLQLVDVNNDSLVDVVVNAWSETGAPDVYLNDGSGVLTRVDPAKFPAVAIGLCCNPAKKQSVGIFYDFNGDKLLDLVYQPYAVSSRNSGDQPIIYFANKALN
ncbi:MAG: FG-GAP repeat domain-containing protein [Burkholderiaceae bacterium]